MAKTQLLHLPFAAGQNEDADPKLLPEGFLTRAKNVRLRKDGRWGVRRDFTALAQTHDAPGTTVSATQLVGMAGGRLLQFGTESGDAYARDLYEYVGQTSQEWHSTTQGSGTSKRVSPIHRLRNLGRWPNQVSTVSSLDVAVIGDLACLVFESDSKTYVHVFQPSTDTTIAAGVDSTIVKPRVVACDGSFFVAGISSSDEILLSRIVASTVYPNLVGSGGTAVSAAGDPIIEFDLAARDDTDVLVAVIRDTPASEIVRVDTDIDNTVLDTITGDTTLGVHTGVCGNATHVAHAITEASGAGSDVRVTTYLVSTGALVDGPDEIFTSNPSAAQPGLTNASSTQFLLFVLMGTSAPFRIDGGLLGYATIGGSSADASWRNVAAMTSKPLPTEDASLASWLVAFATVGGFNALGALNLYQPLGAKDALLATAPGRLGTLAYDATTQKAYWANLSTDRSGLADPVVTELDLEQPGWFQTAEIAGYLYFAAGGIFAFDGRQAFEAGFHDVPVIHSTSSSNSTGSLTSSATYTYALTWEWEDSNGGNLHESTPSEVATITLGASDDTVDVICSAPHTLRDPVSQATYGGTVKLVLWRNVPGKTQLRRTATATLDASNFGARVTITDTTSDASLAANAVIYTQGARGALSGVLPHEPPEPARYVWRWGKRLLTGGLPDPFRAQVSKEVFPGECVNWSGDLAFFVSIPEPIVGVAALDDRAYLFSRERVYQFSGDGPDETGAGEFSKPQPLPSSTGLHRAQSLVETPLGLMFQGDPDKIYLIPRGGGAPVWFSRAVRDTLAAFPVVTGACVVREQQLVVFGCRNEGGTDGRLVCYDLRAQTWTVDEFDGSTPIDSVCAYQGRIAYASSGVAYLEDEDYAPASFIAHQLTTGTVRPFGDNAHGRLVRVVLLGEYRGNCTLSLLVSYDDGNSWVTHPTTHDLDSADGLTAGDAVRRSWTPGRWKGDRFRFAFPVAALSGAASEGFAFNEYTLEVVPSMGGPRLSSSERA